MLPKNNLPVLKDAKDQMASLIVSYKPSKSIQRLEIKIKPIDMLSWLSLQKDEVKIYGANQSDTVAISGIGQAVCIKGNKLVSFKSVFKKLRSYLSPQYPYLQWYGGFCFDDCHQDKDWADFGSYRFVLPRFELAAQGGKMIFCCNLVGKENIAEILEQLRCIGVPSKENAVLAKDSIVKRIDKPNLNLWQKSVDQILADQSIQKVVLARKTSLYFKRFLDPWAMLRQLKAVTPNSYHFAFQFNQVCFLGASPERLFKRQGRSIESEALAGTLPKSSNPRLLLKSVKNQHEHELVVDAIFAAFIQLCFKSSHEREPGVLTLPNGHHLITKFTGQLKDGINDEDILQLLHPTPALGGTPRKKAMAKIRKLEVFSRGWYGAPVGYVGLDWAEFVVGIRSGLVSGKQLAVFAGAGIVQGSQAGLEWNEVENKISNFIKIIR